MGMGLLRLRRSLRYVQPRYRGGNATAGPRREVRFRVPHTGEEPRLRFHRVRAQVKRCLVAAVELAVAVTTDRWESIMNNRRRISRRVVLSGALLSLGAATSAAMVSRAAAQQKLSQADAKYQTTPRGEQHCDGCVNFQAPNACKFVDGDISPNGWCQLFGPKPKS